MQRNTRAFKYTHSHTYAYVHKYEYVRVLLERKNVNIKTIFKSAEIKSKL